MLNPSVSMVVTRTFVKNSICKYTTEMNLNGLRCIKEFRLRNVFRYVHWSEEKKSQHERVVVEKIQWVRIKRPSWRG